MHIWPDYKIKLTTKSKRVMKL